MTVASITPQNHVSQSSSITKQSLLSLSGAGSGSANNYNFKTGSQLPTLNDAKKTQQQKAPQFDEEYEDEFEDGFGEDEEEDDDCGDFDANELLNLTDYQNKRK